ncbi:hypothetical protein ABIB75_002094 [Bradyrhizobium sp. GM2.2]
MSAQTTADPRKACARFVHVNSPLDRAIALHRAAYGHDEEWFALQTILFAATPPSMTFARSSTMCPRFPLRRGPGLGETPRQRAKRGCVASHGASPGS